MIAIDRIRIEGFRSIQALEMPIDRTTLLIGPNNCGKTSVLKALQVALTDEYDVTVHDFHRHPDGTIATDITIDVHFIPVDEVGQRTAHFSPDWEAVLKPHIQHTERSKAYFAFRTHLTWDPDQKLITRRRQFLSDWAEATLGDKIDAPLPYLKMCFLEADDDLHSALLRPNSFMATTFSQLREEVKAHPQYAKAPIEDLRQQLNRLCESLEGPGSTLPDQLVMNPQTIGRFLDWAASSEASQKLDASLGRGSQKTLLVLSAITMIEGVIRQARAHHWPLFMLIAAEEPEAHLHPNAQRTLINQIMALSHQLLISSHSPYVASVVSPQAFRAMSRTGDDIHVRWLPRKMNPQDVRALKRLILRIRGEVLFARGLIFVEGVTEEQLLRGMFHAYFGADPSTFGITIVGVDGKSYAPFFLLAMTLRTPFCVVSDNDGDTAHVVRKQLAESEEKAQFNHQDNLSDVFFLSPGLAIEGELVHKLKLREELIDSLMACSRAMSQSSKEQQLRYEHYNALSRRDLKHRLEKKKSEYSGFLGDIIQENPYHRPLDALLPTAVKSAFQLIEKWIHADQDHTLKP